MPLTADLRMLYRLALSPIRGSSHAARLESFYSHQAADYDATRKTMLWGRDGLFESLPTPADGVWADMGAGTGANLEVLGKRIEALKDVHLVDLSDSLLNVARQRVERNCWRNIAIHRADATTAVLPARSCDVVTFSYSLTMIPDWFAAIDRAWEMLKPGGHIGVVDFYVSRKHPENGRARHAWPTRHFWPAWFGNDNVFPNPDHLPYLQRKFETVRLVEAKGSMRYLPLVRIPYYLFIGRKAD